MNEVNEDLRRERRSSKGEKIFEGREDLRRERKTKNFRFNQTGGLDKILLNDCNRLIIIVSTNNPGIHYCLLL